MIEYIYSKIYRIENTITRENSTVPSEVSCLHFIWSVGWKIFYLSHPNEKFKKKKKISANIGYLLAPHFLVFLSNFLSSPYSSPTVGYLFSPYFSVFSLICLFSPYSSPTYLHIRVFFSWSVHFSSSLGTCVFCSFPYMICTFRLLFSGVFGCLLVLLDLCMCCWVFSSEIF